jgi:hypothetical protein
MASPRPAPGCSSIAKAGDDTYSLHAIYETKWRAVLDALKAHCAGPSQVLYHGKDDGTAMPRRGIDGAQIRGLCAAGERQADANSSSS